MFDKVAQNWNSEFAMDSDVNNTHHDDAVKLWLLIKSINFPTGVTFVLESIISSSSFAIYPS